MALISKASLLMVPSTYEAGTLYNVLPSGNRAPDSTDQNSGYDQTRADFTFDRGSNAAATRVNADGLIEKYRENILLRSNDFDTTWTEAGSSGIITSGFEGYDGTNDAWQLEHKGSQYTSLRQTLSSSGVQTYSLYAKAGTLDYVVVYAQSSVSPKAWFNLSNGTIGTQQGSTIDASIESVGNGWYRCSIVFNDTLAGVRIYPNDGDGAYGTTAGTIYIQNAQLEKGLVATDYLDSGATTAKAGVLIDLPRINYDANGENGALLLEPSRANLVQYSEYFGAWNKSTGDITITQNYGISPEGVKNSSRIQFTNSNQHINISTSLGVGVVSTGSVYIKGTNGETIQFDTGGAGSLKTLNGDWQRIEVTSTSVSSLLLINTFGGATARDIEVWGAQCEQASYATSYIPNHGTSGGVTRAADSITSGTITAPLSGGYTAFIEFETQSTSVYNQIQFRETAANYVFRVGNQINVGAGSTIQTNTTGMNKFALQVSSGGAYELFKNGSSVATGTGITHDIELIKTDLAGQGVKQIAVFNEALTDAECITLTTL